MWNARFRDLLPQWGNRLSPTLVRQMELGKDTTGEAVGRALLARTQLYRKVQGWFDRFDVIAMPTLARTAIPIEERLFEPIEIEGRKVDTVRKAWYPYTHPFNLTGHPAITLPCGFHSDGLPMAIQLVGRRGEDARLLARRGPLRGGAAVGRAAAADRRRGLTFVGRALQARAVRPAGQTPQGCDGTRVPIRQPRGRCHGPRRPARASSESLAGSRDLTVPGCLSAPAFGDLCPGPPFGFPLRSFCRSLAIAP